MSRPARKYHDVLDAGASGAMSAGLLSEAAQDAVEPGAAYGSAAGGERAPPPAGGAVDADVEEEEEEDIRSCRERCSGKELGCIDIPMFWKKPGRGPRTWMLRSIVIFCTLTLSTYIAMSIKCLDGYNWIIQGFLTFPSWPCNEYMPETWGKAPAWQAALSTTCQLNDAKCLAAQPRKIGYMRNSQGQALCTNNGGKSQFGGCSPTNITTVYCVMVVNFLLAAFYFAGEYCIQKFDKNSGDYYSRSVNGPKWQLELDRADEARGKKTPHQKVETDAIKHSSQWNDELAQWHELKARGKEVVGKDLGGRAVIMYILFFFVATFDILMVVLISPNSRSTASYEVWPWIVDNIISTVNILPLSQDPQTGAWNQWSIPFFSKKPDGSYKFQPVPSFGTDYGIYAYIILGQFSLEFALFMMCVLTVRWQQPTVIADRDAIESGRMRRVDVGRVKDVGGSAVMTDQADEHQHKIRDTCLLIACHLSCIAPDATETFCNTLRAALRVFPPSAVFVCDNHPYSKDHYGNKTIGPFDRTEEVCDMVSKEFHASEKINYVFIPEGNKSHAMYWTTEYWIPELVARGECINFSYCMMIDDDVPIPHNLQVPVNILSRNPEIKAICYVIEAKTEDGSANALVELQDAEYKLAGLVKQFQWQYGTTLCCHGAISLWRRDVLGRKILWDHDTEFHGEDLYMGILLHRMRKNYAIMVLSDAIVPTYAPEDMLTLFRQRVTSWDLCAQRKFMTQVKSFVFGWCNTRTLILKPFILQEVFNVMLDWIRIYLMTALLVRNPVGLLLCFILFYGILYVEMGLFNYVVLRSRPLLKVKVRTIILFPFYRTLSLAFRLYALLRNVMIYALRRKKMTIAEREETVHDLPPVPPVSNPDWFSIWNKNKVSDDKLTNDLTSELVKPLMMLITDPMERRRLRLLVRAFLMYRKLLIENSQVRLIQILRPADGAPGDRTARQLATSMNHLKLHFEECLKQMMSTRFEMFKKRLRKSMHQWTNSKQHFFYESKYDNAQGDNVLINEIIEANYRVLESIEELIHATRYPHNHDPTVPIKEGLRNVQDVIEKRQMGESTRRETAKTVQELLQKLQALKKLIDSKNVDQLASAQSNLAWIEEQTRSLPAGGEWQRNIIQVVKRYKKDIARILTESDAQQ